MTKFTQLLASIGGAIAKRVRIAVAALKDLAEDFKSRL
jgi:hypothetical protein